MDYGLEAQKAAEAHLAACQEAFWDWEEPDPDEPEQKESPASAPFCNCDTCIVREVLFAAWPIVYEAVKEDFIVLLEGFTDGYVKDKEGGEEGLHVLRRFRNYSNEVCWSPDLVDHDQHPSIDRYRNALLEIQRLPGQTLVTQQIVGDALTDRVRAEAEDQDQRGSDQSQHHVLEGQVHPPSVPLSPDE